MKRWNQEIKTYAIEVEAITEHKFPQPHRLRLERVEGTVEGQSELGVQSQVGVRLGSVKNIQKQYKGE